MPEKILVTYASRSGSTLEVAEAIRDELSKNGLPVDIVPVEEQIDLSQYRVVVIGSAVRYGQWLPEAVMFIKEHQEALREIQVVYFTVSMTLQENTAENRAAVLHYLDPVRHMVEPLEVGLFAGKMDMKKYGFLDRLRVRFARMPQGDYRDWEAIHAWAKTLADRLKQG